MQRRTKIDIFNISYRDSNTLNTKFDLPANNEIEEHYSIFFQITQMLLINYSL